MDYEKTPSFYNSEEYFNKYLGQTSYYLGLQNVVDKMIELIRPKQVFELGSALGTTTIQMARKYRDVSFVGLDIRKDIIFQANDASKSMSNIYFIEGDMCEYVNNDLSENDLIYMLYSFHHIIDPEENKVRFLEKCYNNMKEGTFLLIAETFLPDCIKEQKEDKEILDLFKLRAQEGYASTFWASLNSLSSEGLQLSKRIAKTSFREESKAGELVYRREEEYLVTFQWLCEICSSVGFKIVLAEPVNNIMEKALLLKR